MRLAIRSTGLPFAGQLHHNRQLSRRSGNPLLTFRGSRAAGGGTADGSAARSRSGASRAEVTPQPADGEFLELMRGDVAVAGLAGVGPEVPGERLADGQLIDLAGPDPHRVLFPDSPVPPRPEQ